ncbi:MAG: hypothetical protein LN417_07090 [Candidatus Thermoplasmatota archaeon]|nr:hypothetical protein [Candidatus Thermoplasmatota archaeon]
MSPRREKEAETCEISGCDEEAVRSIPSGKLKSALPDMSIDKERGRMRICKKHYREYKKATKEDRELHRLSWK